MRRGRSRAAAIAAGAALASLALAACATEEHLAESPADARPTAVVAMGDSFISGEAGRWLGNSHSGGAGHGGTDRAHRGDTTDPALVYGATVEDGCHRSDVADIASSGIQVDARINLACSGASARHLWRAASGGEGYKGEAPQADQLAAVAAGHRVEMVVISVGGNDLGYSDIATRCGLSFVMGGGGSGCTDEAAAELERSVGGAMEGIGKAVDEVRAVMSAAGQDPGSYRIVLRTYPSPLPRGSDNRYEPSASERLREGGCPFGDAASDWAHDAFVPRLATELGLVAASRGVELLDLSEALAGHEVCARTAQQVGAEGPDGATAEWVRWVDLLFRQGSGQESLHPNAFGQMAMGRCVALVHEAGVAPRHTCVNTPGEGPEGMRLD